MEHKGNQNVLKDEIPHPSSCSLVSCLSLNLPALKPSAHGLDKDVLLESSRLGRDLTSVSSLSIMTSFLTSQISVPLPTAADRRLNRCSMT